MFARFKSPERLSKEINTNTVSQIPKAIASKNCKKPPVNWHHQEIKEVNVIISEKGELSMGRDLRVHHIFPKSSTQRMQNPLNFHC